MKGEVFERECIYIYAWERAQLWAYSISNWMRSVTRTRRMEFKRILFFYLFVLTFCLSLMDPLPRTAILVMVSSCSLFIEFPLGPSSLPTKLN